MLVFNPSCAITVIPTHRAITYFPLLSLGYTFHTPLGSGHAQWACLSPYKLLSFSYSFRPDEVYSSRWKLVFNESTVLFQRKSTSTKDNGHLACNLSGVSASSLHYQNSKSLNMLSQCFICCLSSNMYLSSSMPSSCHRTKWLAETFVKFLKCMTVACLQYVYTLCPLL